VAKLQSCSTDLRLVASRFRKIRNSETEHGEKTNALRKLSSVNCMLYAAMMYWSLKLHVFSIPSCPAPKLHHNQHQYITVDC